MLLEDKILYEIKKENIKRIRLESVYRLGKQLKYTERKMLNEGYSRKYINQICRGMIEDSEKDYHVQLINENMFSDFLYSTLSTIAPGIESYLKLLVIRWIFKKLGIDTNSKLAGFFINALKNVKFTEIFTYFQEGKCPLIVESLIGAVVDSLIEYVTIELGKAVPPEGSDPEMAAVDDPGYIESMGRKLIDAGLPAGLFRLFAGAAEELGGSGVMLNIIQDNVKRHLMPPLTKKLSSIVCKDLSYEEISNIIDQSRKSITAKEREAQAAEEQNNSELKPLDNKKVKEQP